MACAFVEQVLRNSIRDASPLRNSAMVVASEVHSPSRGSLHQPQYLQGDTDGRGQRRRQAGAQAAAMGGARYGSGGASRADAAWLGRWRRSGGADREGRRGGRASGGARSPVLSGTQTGGRGRGPRWAGGEVRDGWADGPRGRAEGLRSDVAGDCGCGLVALRMGRLQPYGQIYFSTIHRSAVCPALLCSACLLAPPP
jgi:hypothetical protein